MTPSAADRPYHHGNLRAELLAHAERMLDESGQDGLSLRELARAAGVSHGAPRRHFADRQALLDALAAEGFERLRGELDAAMTDAAMTDAVMTDAVMTDAVTAGEGTAGRETADAETAGPGRSFADRLETFAQAYVSFAIRHTELLRLMHTIKDRPGAGELREANNRAFAAPMRLIAEARASGEVVADDPDRVAMAVLALLQGLATVITTGITGDRDVTRLVSGAVRTLVEGLRPRAGRADA
ncbi:TetR/AcrR family transcriptional regulator [Streptomyces sp. NBC_01476]|uniref:TetR/AcrR family transcriptional regulator n=1 Tax=Streptomyces sp. NBC_01476 TaxID=2903881 RepID=UPI002E3733C4|nr:TetR/AcrR family transcriptional regulator [Streptomyces sp. NBC_01476]